jgi:hypothetical protein
MREKGLSGGQRPLKAVSQKNETILKFEYFFKNK